MAPFLVAAGAMFAVMYSTQAILPDLAAEFDVTPSQAGLSISVVIGALAVGAWFWGPLSDRIGRRAARSSSPRCSSRSPRASRRC
jgi:YNFM family putative membrane transporter